MTAAASPSRPASRARVLAILRESGAPVGVAALVAATGLSPNAVRFHIQRLIAAGSVRAETDADHTGPGRPVVHYFALPAEAAEPAAAYQLLARLLANTLRRSAPTAGPAEAGRDWARTLAPAVSDAARQDPVGAVRDLFVQTGFAPTIRADGRTIELHHCPFFELAAQQPEVVCSIHLGLVTEVLAQLGSAGKVRLVPVLDGSGPCLVRLSAPPSKPPVAVPATPR